MRLPSKWSMFRVSKSAPLEGVWVFVGFSVPLLLFFLCKRFLIFFKILGWFNHLSCRTVNKGTIHGIFERDFCGFFHGFSRWVNYDHFIRRFQSYCPAGGERGGYISSSLDAERLKSKPQLFLGDIHLRKLTWEWTNIILNRIYISSNVCFAIVMLVFGG